MPGTRVPLLSCGPLFAVALTAVQVALLANVAVLVMMGVPELLPSTGWFHRLFARLREALQECEQVRCTCWLALLSPAASVHRTLAPLAAHSAPPPCPPLQPHMEANEARRLQHIIQAFWMLTQPAKDFEGQEVRLLSAGCRVRAVPCGDQLSMLCCAVLCCPV